MGKNYITAFPTPHIPDPIPPPSFHFRSFPRLAALPSPLYPSGMGHSCGSGGCGSHGKHDQRGGGQIANKPCCGGRDLGPIQDHEGPSEADIARFGDVTQNCPECKSELYDDAEVCWKCGHALMGSGQATPVPKWMFISAGLVLAGFVIALLVR
jgi:hypothetical protein